MSARADFAAEARWEGRGVGVRLRTSGTCADVTGPGGRLIVGGELHGPGDAADPVRAILMGTTPRGVEPLAGGFAAALIDQRAETVRLAVDPFGIRRLYYWSNGERVVFGTQLRDVVDLLDARPAVDPAAVYHYLNFAYVPGPGTIYRDVFVLPPGTIARCTKGKVTLETYWDMTYPADVRGPDDRLAHALRSEIERAVRGSWPGMPRGEVGCFLSGGTDSGTIAAIASTIEAPLKAYSIAFTEDAYDELSYAKVLADRLRLDHRVHRLTAGDLLESIPVLLDASDEPFGNPSAVATWRCTRLARDTGVEMLLAGDGGDEIFGGNERYAKDRVYALYRRLPAWTRRGALALVNAAPVNGVLVNRVRNFAYRGTLVNPEHLYSDDAFASKHWQTLVTDDLRRRVTRHASLDVMRAHWDAVGPVHEIDRLMYVDLKTAIWGNDLVKVTTAARATDVRVRFPFLDPGLAAFTGRLGGPMKVRGLEKRYLFRRAVAGLLPQRVLDKPKHGFGVPVAEWVRHDRRVREAVLDPIVDRASGLDGYLTRAGRERLIDEHLNGQWDHGTWLWALMMLARWDRAQKDRHGQR